MLYAQLSAPPPPLTKRLPWLAPAVDTVLGRGLAKYSVETGDLADERELLGSIDSFRTAARLRICQMTVSWRFALTLGC